MVADGSRYQGDDRHQANNSQVEASSQGASGDGEDFFA